MPIVDQLRQRDLTYAIANASLEDVKRALAAGSDPNMEPLGSDYHSPLEHAFAEHCAGRPHMEDIIRDLIKSGVSPEVRRETLFRASMELGNRRSARNPYARRVTPERLRDVISILKNYEPAHSEYTVVEKQPTARATIQMWNKLLFSDKFSDVQFLFSDGTVVHAHKCVLAAASPYFDAYFEGPWGNLPQHQNGIWKTSNPLPVMKAVLMFIYTGAVDTAILMKAENLSDTLSLSVQYQLKDLQKLVEASLQKALTLETLKDTLVTAQLYDLLDLKAACFDFIRDNSLQVMFEPSIMSMSQEYPELWTELARAVGGRNNKRARFEEENEDAIEGEGGNSYQPPLPQEQQPQLQPQQQQQQQQLQPQQLQQQQQQQQQQQLQHDFF